MQYYPSGLPWNQNFHASEQPFKYNGKEFVEMGGLDEYDSEARWYYPAIMRTTTMDPLCEKYYDISPYAWCNNNPANLVDPDGREYDTADDVIFHNELCKAIKARITDLKEQGGNKRKEIRSLNKALKELEYMKETKDFTFHFGESSIEHGGETYIKDGKIVMGLPQEGKLYLGAHESSHAYDLSQKILKLGGDIEKNGEEAFYLVNTIAGEQKAYQRQFLVGGHEAMPSSKNLTLQPGELMLFRYITPLYIRGIIECMNGENGTITKLKRYEKLRKK